MLLQFTVWVAEPFLATPWLGDSQSVVTAAIARTVRAPADIGFQVRVLVSGKYQPVSEVGGFYQWKADQSVATAETTDFTAARSGWETYMSLGVLNAKITAARHWDTAGFRQRVGTPVLVRCYVSVATGEQYTAWAIPASSGADSDRDKVVDEPIAFALIGPLHYRSSN